MPQICDIVHVFYRHYRYCIDVLYDIYDMGHMVVLWYYPPFGNVYIGHV